MSADVSVIITSYNVERYIERAIHSALKQQDVSVEVIVVDDCSTDATWRRIGEISDPRLKTQQLPANGGPSVARNAAIAQATGKWIAVLDGDDVFALYRLKNCLARAKALGADMVVDNLMVCSEKDGTEKPMFAGAFDRLETLSLAGFIDGNRSFLYGYAYGYLKPVISAEFLREKALTYDAALRIGEDYALFAGLLASGAVCAVEHSAGYRYTVRNNSISHRLTLADVERISRADGVFKKRYTMAAAAQEAQKRREHHLREAFAYTQLIDALKRLDVAGAAKAVSACPSAVRHMWMPVWARMKRFSRG